MFVLLSASWDANVTLVGHSVVRETKRDVYHHFKVHPSLEWNGDAIICRGNITFKSLAFMILNECVMELQKSPSNHYE